MASAVTSGVFEAPKLPPNENAAAGFVDEVVVVTEPGSDAGGVIVEANEANEKLEDGVVTAASFDVDRFNENPLLDAPKMELDDGAVDPNPENTDADVTAGELPKPEKIGVLAGAADDIAFGAFVPLLSFAVLLAANGLAVVEGSPNEKPFVESPALESRDEKFGVPAGALMVTTDESSFFSDSLNVNEAFSLFDGGLFSSCLFSPAFDGSL